MACNNIMQSTAEYSQLVSAVVDTTEDLAQRRGPKSAPAFRKTNQPRHIQHAAPEPSSVFFELREHGSGLLRGSRVGLHHTIHLRYGQIQPIKPLPLLAAGQRNGCDLVI